MLRRRNNSAVSQLEDYLNNTTEIPELSDALEKCLKKLNECLTNVVGAPSNTSGLDILLEQFVQRFISIQSKQKPIMNRLRRLGKDLNDKHSMASFQCREMRNFFVKSVGSIASGLIILSLIGIPIAVVLALVVFCVMASVRMSEEVIWRAYKKVIDDQKKVVGIMTVNKTCFESIECEVNKLKCKMRDKDFMEVTWKLSEILGILETTGLWIERWTYVNHRIFNDRSSYGLV